MDLDLRSFPDRNVPSLNQHILKPHEIPFIYFLLLRAEPASFPLLSLEDEGIFTTSSSAATTPQSQDTTEQEMNIPPNESGPEDEGTDSSTDA